MSKKSIFITLALTLLFSALPLQAQGPRGFGGDPLARMKAVKDKLNLSDEQEQQLKDIRRSYAKKFINYRADIQLTRLELSELTDVDQPDRKAVEAKMKQIGDIQLKQKMALYDMGQEIKSILSPEQYETWKDICKMHRMKQQKMKQQMKMQKHGGMGGGFGGR